MPVLNNKPDLSGDRLTIEIGPDAVYIVLALLTVAVALALAFRVLDPSVIAGTRPRHISVANFAQATALILGGGGTAIGFLLRRALILDATGVRRRVGPWEARAAWAEVTQIALIRCSTGRGTVPGIVIDLGAYRRWIIWETWKISGAEMFRRIDGYVTTHGIPVRTENAIAAKRTGGVA